MPFSWMSSNIPMKQKNVSLLKFFDILPKEQFHGLLWGYEFSKKGCKPSDKGQSYYVTHLTDTGIKGTQANRLFTTIAYIRCALTTVLH
jgi:hypothetical protein